MQFHVFGSREKPVILCLHGMLQKWETEYALVKPLEEVFCLIVPAMDGMYPGSPEFTTFAEQCRQIEEFVCREFEGRLLGVYGASQGATVLSELLARNRICVHTAVFDGIYLAHQGKLAAAFGCWVGRKVKSNGGHFPKIMDIPMKLMGLGEDDYAMFQTLYLDVSDRSMRNNFYENYTYHVNPAIRQSPARIHLWCGEKEPYALKSHKILKRYIVPVEERIDPNMGHGQMLLKHTTEYILRLKQVFTMAASVSSGN